MIDKKNENKMRRGLRGLQYNILTHNNQTKIRMRHREDEEEEIRGEGGKGTVIWYIVKGKIKLGRVKN